MVLSVEFPNDERRELILLSLWYRSRHSPGFRRPVEKTIGATIDPETGLERSEGDLLPQDQAICGPEYVFSCPVMPDRLAEEILLRDEWDGSTPSYGQAQAIGIQADIPDPEMPGTTKPALVFKCPTNERGRAESELLQIQKDHPEWGAKIRMLQGREAWTDEENMHIAEMTYLWQRTMLDFAAKGWLRLEPPFKFESDTGNNATYAKGVDHKGLPYIATVTPEGLEEAERRISKDPIYSQGARSMLAAMSGEQKAKVMARNPWAHQRYLKE